MVKDDWYGVPSALLNPRITIAGDNATNMEAALKERKVSITDPVQAYDDGFDVKKLPDSEGNKLWFGSPIERNDATTL